MRSLGLDAEGACEGRLWHAVVVFIRIAGVIIVLCIIAIIIITIIAIVHHYHHHHHHHHHRHRHHHHHQIYRSEFMRPAHGSIVKYNDETLRTGANFRTVNTVTFNL